MAENKKSFVLYTDLIHTVSKMPNDKAGELFKHILMYVNDENPITDDLILQLTFEPIKQQFKRDLKKWEETIEVKSKGGRIGNLKRWNKDLYDKFLSKEITLEEAEIIAYNRITSHTDKNNRKASQSIANIAVNVNDNVNVNVNDIISKDITTNVEKIEKWILELKNETIYLEGLYRMHKLQSGTVYKIALKFLDHLKVYPKQHKDFNDFKKHFSSWIGQQKLKGELNSFNEVHKTRLGI